MGEKTYGNPFSRMKKDGEGTKPVSFESPALADAVSSNVPRTSKIFQSARPVRRDGEKIAVFIDLDNTNASVDNLLEIFSVLRGMGSVVYGKLYGYTDEQASLLADFVAEQRLTTTGKMRFKNDNVSVIDTHLVTDCLEIATKDKPDMVFVWTGVGDLIPLFAELQENGCKVITVDLPEFDCKNKFVSQALHLYSSHHPVGEKYKVNKEGIESVKEKLAVDAPELPRKKGAPEFGAKPKQEVEPEPDDEIDFAGIAQSILRDLEAEREQREELEKLTGNFGDLESTVSEPEPEKKADGFATPKLPRKKGAPPKDGEPAEEDADEGPAVSALRDLESTRKELEKIAGGFGELESETTESNEPVASVEGLDGFGDLGGTKYEAEEDTKKSEEPSYEESVSEFNKPASFNDD